MYWWVGSLLQSVSWRNWEFAGSVLAVPLRVPPGPDFSPLRRSLRGRERLHRWPGPFRLPRSTRPSPTKDEGFPPAACALPISPNYPNIFLMRAILFLLLTTT